MSIERWAWAADGRFPGFCLTFIKDRTAAAIVAALGADPQLMRAMSGAEAETTYPISRPGSLLRCGSIGAWTFCFEDRAPVANRHAAAARLSAGTELLQVTKGGDGMTIVSRLADSNEIEVFEPTPGAPVRGIGPYELLPLVTQVMITHPTTPALVASLHIVGDRVGGVLDRDILDGYLPTALTVSARPALAARPPRSGPPPGLGRRLGAL